MSRAAAKFFIIYCNSVQPKLLKTVQTTKKYQLKYPDLKVKQFTNLNEAEGYMTQINNLLQNKQTLSNEIIDNILQNKSNSSSTTPDDSSNIKQHTISNIDNNDKQSKIKEQSQQPQKTLKENNINNGFQEQENNKEQVSNQPISSQKKQQKQSSTNQFVKNSNVSKNFKSLLYFYKHEEEAFNKIKQEINEKNNYLLFFDGATKNNPGPSGVGYLIYNELDKKKIFENALNIGFKTNNQAEYLALLYGLYSSIHLGIKRIKVFGDSLFVISQVTHKYRVKKQELIPYNLAIEDIKQHFQLFEISHIPRENNTMADKLSTKGLYAYRRPDKNSQEQQ